MRNYLQRLLALWLVFASVALPPSHSQENKKEAQQDITKVKQPIKLSGEKIFKQHCASCHTGGGNNIKPNRPVTGSKELITLAKFKAYLSYPPGHMPYYQNVVDNQRILEALYRYCKQLPKQPVKQVMNRDSQKTVWLRSYN